MWLSLVQTVCLAFSSPEFYLSEYRLKTVCNSIDTIAEESSKNELDPTLLMALIYVESGWNKRAVSQAGACGLTQVMPKYTGSRLTGTKKYTCRQLKNPKISIRVGAKTLRYWIDTYAGGDVRVGLCGYNEGFRCKGRKHNRSGMRYADKVMDTRRKIINRILHIKKN